MENVINFKKVREQRGAIPEVEEFPLSHWNPRAPVAPDVDVLSCDGRTREQARAAFLVKQAAVLRQLRDITYANDCTSEEWIRLLEIEMEAVFAAARGVSDVSS